jgi:predicted MFS family arabinose efflux permease
MCVGVVVVSLAALAIGPGTVGTVLAVLGWGIGFTAIPVSLQSAAMRVAPDAHEASSAVYVVAFQIGIGGGALVGDRLVASGHLGVLPTAAAIAALAALGLVFASRKAFPSRVA